MFFSLLATQISIHGPASTRSLQKALPFSFPGINKCKFQYGTIIDAYVSIEYTSRGYMLHFAEEGTMHVFDVVNC